MNVILPRVDAGEFGRFRIAADRVDVAAEPRARGEERHDDADARARSAPESHSRCEMSSPPSGTGILLLRRIGRGDALGPVIGVDDRGRAERDEAADDRDDIFRPHRPQREMEPRAPLPAGDRGRTRCRRRQIAATIQLAVAPIEPCGPPPISAKRSSSGAMVWPAVTHQAAPRQNNWPPSVTMKAGMPR